MMRALQDSAESVRRLTAPAQRCHGAVSVRFREDAGVTRLADLYQSNPGRVLFPDVAAGQPPQAVVVTISGGLTGGDSFRIELAAEAGTCCTATTQAAEKIYRSDGADCRIDIALSAKAGALLEWVPQETILFDGARLRRETVIDLCSGSRLNAGEITIFGRTAQGESFRDGLLLDRWRVRRDGRLIWYDATRLAGDIQATMSHPACFDGAVATASFLHCGPDGTAALALAREILASREAAGLRVGASLVNGLMLVRWIGGDAAQLRTAFLDFWLCFRSARELHNISLSDAPPRVWLC